MRGYAVRVLVLVGVFLAGAVGGVEWREPVVKSVAAVARITTGDEIREASRSSGSLTNQLLECAELPESVSDTVIEATKSDINDLLTSRKKGGDILYASVYYRDLSNGPWFGINESDKFFPASLLKLPLAMSFYDKAETDPTLLGKEIVYKADPSITSQLQPYGSQDLLKEGQKYTVQHLLDIMLTESNNEAAGALASVAGQDLIDEVYRDLRLTLPVAGKDYAITTHKYASFFRILYNATYVDRAASEKILKTLTGAAFNDGLVAGVPIGTKVAHKFGTRGIDEKTVQLHDCGIIYAPNKPYILCVMTQGNDFTKLADVIKNISQIVYQNIATDNAPDSAK